MEPSDEPGRQTWRRWRGSPALFTHVARVIQQAADHTSSSPDYRITVHVSGDVEAFKTPEEFQANVTPEALAHFVFLRVCMNDPAFNIELEFKRTAPAVRLTVESKGDPDKAKTAFQKVNAAIARGVPAWYRGFVFIFSAATATVIINASAEYLVSAQWKWAQHIFHNPLPRNVLLYSVGGSFWLWFLLRPRVEIAEVGQTRLWRMTRIIGPVLAGLVVAAIAKWLLKSG